MTALVQPDYTNVPWSFESPNCVFNYYENPTRVVGGNPLIIYVHGGGGKSNDARILTHGGTRPQCVVFETLMASTGDGPHFDFIGLNLDQLATWKPHPNSAVGSSWKTAGDSDPDTGLPSSAPTYPNATYPNGRDIMGAANVNEAAWGIQPTYSIGRFAQAMVVDQLKRAIISIKSMAQTALGDLPFNHEKVWLLGTSYGGWLAMTSQAQPPLVAPKYAALCGYEWFPILPGATSQVRGIINWYGHPDIRVGPAQVIAKGGSATDEPLPQLVSEAFHARMNADQDSYDRLKELHSAQYFMETGQSEFLPPIIHFMFDDPDNSYPLGPPFHQSDLGYDAVRYGGKELRRSLTSMLSDYREQEMHQMATTSFSATTGDGPTMAARILAWARRTGA